MKNFLFIALLTSLPLASFAEKIAIPIGVIDLILIKDEPRLNAAISTTGIPENGCFSHNLKPSGYLLF